MSVFAISLLFVTVRSSIMQPTKNNPEETIDILKDIDAYIVSVTKDRAL